jgi:amidohydrolase
MSISSAIESLAAQHDELTTWRRHLHARPELGFEERETSDFVAAKLAEFGCTVHRGLAGTGIVGQISKGTSPRSIALRAELDALPIQEENDVAHRSQHPGAMHACGHDGHMVMLLAAARHLARHGTFDGTISFVFQPAEENLAGARVMLADGLFAQFPTERIFGMHNRPILPPGQFATRTGPALASADNFGIEVHGHASHAASPHLGIDTVVIAAQIVCALQTIVSRQVNPLDAAVVSVTRIEGGTSDNAIPERVLLRGTARALLPAVQDRIETQLTATAQNIAAIYGATVKVDYERRYPPVINDAAATQSAIAAAASLVGREHVDDAHPPIMGSDDFAYFAEQCPGSFVWIGSGPLREGRYLHHPQFDFNDAILPLGASYWVKLAEAELAPA